MEVLNSIPTPGGLLDDNRKLLFPNKALLAAMREKEFHEALHIRPGEFLKCNNAGKGQTGCGSSEACELCGAFNSMKAARTQMEQETREFRIVSETSEGRQSQIFRFTTSPLVMDDRFHYLFYLEDISGEKRQAELERIFFHDIMNSIGSLHGIINLVKTQNSIDPQHLQILEATYNNIFDTVNEQRQIFQAERGILEVRLDEVHSKDLLIENLLPFKENSFYSSSLQMNEDSADMLLITDPNLLSRILTNMIKNAMEASGKGDTVTVGCELKENSLRFYVQNPGFIPKDIQLQLFERSFSTKGGGRGIGTYSMKLLGEEYLKGEVGFDSSETSGTIFWIDLILDQN